MLFRTLKKQMLLPQKEILINRSVEIRGRKTILVSITTQADETVLWGLQYQPSLGMMSEEPIQCMTNKERLLRNRVHQTNQNDFISELVIQGQKMTFGSCSANRILENSHEAFMRLQHFVESGLSVTELDDYPMDELILFAYKQREGEPFPEFNSSKGLDMTLEIASRMEEQGIDYQPFSLSFQENLEKEKPRFFQDTTQNINRTFYLNAFKHYDIWKEIEEYFISEKFQKTLEAQNLDAKAIEAFKSNYLRSMESVCPRGYDLAVLEYETEDNIQLNFYSNHFLDEKPAPSGSSSVGFILRPDEELGANGYKKRQCMIGPIEKDYEGSMDVVLFSWYKNLPEESLRIGG